MAGDIDFSTAPLTVTFTSGMTMNTANVIILPDTIVESNEMFDLSISVPPLFNGRLSAGNRVNAIGVIVDPTSKKCVLMYIIHVNVTWYEKICRAYVHISFDHILT